MAERRVVDLFAGPGGWDEGLRTLGHRSVGIEIDPSACETAEAAGHTRVRADVAGLAPESMGKVWGLIASPPCQAYTQIGKRLGRLDKAEVVACAEEICHGHDTRSRHLERCRDERSLLTVEPLRWAMALRPRWVALEQVTAVSELWSAFAELLADHGYHCASGILSAERFGVPQVRKRAFLIASLDGAVELPEPTHRSFDPRRCCTSALEGEQGLHGWVSMAAALGWSPLRSRSPRRPSGGATCCEREAPRGADRSVCHRRRRGGLKQADASQEVPAWTHARPATTLLGDPRITAPGSWPRVGRRPELVRGRPIRVSPAEAGVLQGFRRDYPWRGSRGRRFEQIGNAVCPPVAARVLAEAMRPSERRV